MPASKVGPGQATAREERLGEILGQLCRAWSAYRLFPGELDRPAFATAVGRVRDLARPLVSAGPVEIEIVSGRFHHGGRPLPAQEEHLPFARALYSRQVEQIVLSEVPDGGEVAALLEAVRDDGHPVAGKLEEAAVAAFSVGEMAPSATVGTTDGHVRQLDAAERRRWEQLIDVQTVRDEITAAAASEGGVVDLLDRLADTTGAHEAFQRAARDLSDDLKPMISAALLDPDGAVDYRTRLTDVELAAAIVDVDRGDPVATATSFVERRERDGVLVRLVEALADGTDPEGLVDAFRSGEPPAAPGPGSDDQDPDAHDVSLATLERSLVLQRDPDRTRTVLEAWARRTREAVEDRDAQLVARLAAAVAHLRHDPDREDLVDTATEMTLDAPLVRTLLPDDPREELDEVGDLLRPLGDVAVDRLFAVLALEDDRNRRGRLLTLLGDLTRGNVNAVGRWIDDERWYVVRNACCVLGRVATPAAVPLLEYAVDHADPRVRREAMRGIIAALGSDALPLLRRLALDEASTVSREAIQAIASVGTDAAALLLGTIVRDGDVELDRRGQALDELASHPSDRAGPLLSDLLDEVGEELPWRLRRHLEDLVHGHPEAT